MTRKTSILLATLLVAGAATAQMKVQNPQAAPQTNVTAASGSGQQLKPVARPSLDSIRRISVAEAQKLVAQDKAVMVDVRSKEQFDLGHIKGALSIPGSQLMKRLREVPPGKTIITYCACSAEQSSGRAVIDLNAHGVKNAAALQGGWAAWQAAGLPTAKSR